MHSIMFEDCPIEWQYQWNLIREVFDGHLNPKAAAPKLAAVTLPDPIPDLNSEEDEDELIGPIERMFNFMLRHLETDLKRVQPIFNLVICMSQLSPALTGSGQQLCATDPPRRVWEDLPALGTSIGSAWTSKCLVLRMKKID